MADENERAISDLSGIMNMLSGNPELIKMASGILSGLPKAPPPELEDQTLASPAPDVVDIPPPPSFDPALFAKIAPMLSGQGNGVPSIKPSPNDERRCALLQALRPYLSPERREAIDYMLKFSKLTDLMRAFERTQ